MMICGMLQLGGKSPIGTSMSANSLNFSGKLLLFENVRLEIWGVGDE